ncbi:MAG TPA: DEAD/DEAH box helicase [Xanthomonadaceae bacterium]|nr:DEAD/DEAH box helicase [Xanthomonadaceae bacterium]HRY00906.1 DEAD/DEAH box helicase [Xanthomonadaceae bacterium]
MSFESLGLSPARLSALAELGYAEPTPIQQSAIPLVLAGHDLMAGAQTGTGKTAAFALPLLDRLEADNRRAGPKQARVLVLTPTRELALQVHESFREYAGTSGANKSRLKSATVFGGVGMQPQVQALRGGLDVLVACPGRLIDHMQQRTVDLSGVEYLVLDEADRMLDMGFLPSIKRILGALPKDRQTLLFSATFADEIKGLAAQFMRDPQQVQIAARNSVAATVQHRVHPVNNDRKRDLLLHLLSEDSRRQTLVFSRTKHGADKLVRILVRAGLKAAAIHGNKSQGARTKALDDFKSGRVTTLVATDIAARGLDIDQLPAVINYELPMVAEDYVHRIGRTGRAGADGQAISLVSHDEVKRLHAIQKLIGREIKQQPVVGFEPESPLASARPQHGNGAGNKPPRSRHGNGQNRSNGPSRNGGQNRGNGQNAGRHAGAPAGRGSRRGKPRNAGGQGQRG